MQRCRRVDRRWLAISLPLAVSVALSCGLANAEAIPSQGTFSGFLFTDRWGQAVLGYLYVSPRVMDQLGKPSPSWQPVRLKCSRIRQIINPGGGMIYEVDEVTRLNAPGLKLTLDVTNCAILENDKLVVQIGIENDTGKPFQIQRDRLAIQITAAAVPVAADGIRDRRFSINSYGRGTIEPQRFRARFREPLYVSPEIAAGSKVTLSHTIKANLLPDEYELQLRYRPGKGTFVVPEILSPPVSVDVIGTAGIALPER